MSDPIVLPNSNAVRSPEEKKKARNRARVREYRKRQREALGDAARRPGRPTIYTPEEIKERKRDRIREKRRLEREAKKQPQAPIAGELVADS